MTRRTFDVAFVGTSAGPDQARDAFGPAERLARAYERLDDCRLVGCADDDLAAAAAFATAFEIPEDAVFPDYEALLAAQDPDLVTVCTPPDGRADVVIDMAERGDVDAIHCATPVAQTWGGAREMARICEANGVQLTFDHPRRFGEPLRAARRALESGAIGHLQRVECTWGRFPRDGTQAVDVCNYLTGDRPAGWVMGQIDSVDSAVAPDAPAQTAVLACWEYETGVYGVVATGPAADLAGADWQLVGTDGVIAVSVTDEILVDVATTDPATRETLRFDDLAPSTSCPALAAADVVQSLDDGHPSELCATNALSAAEIVFAGYESVRRRGRVELPLDVEDNPLESMVAAGALSRTPASDD